MTKPSPNALLSPKPAPIKPENPPSTPLDELREEVERLGNSMGGLIDEILMGADLGLFSARNDGRDRSSQVNPITQPPRSPYVITQLPAQAPTNQTAAVPELSSDPAADGSGR